MAYEHPLTTAVDTAWTVYRATHEGVEEADVRHCLLARHLNGRPEAREGNVEELRARLPCAAARRMLSQSNGLVRRIAAGSARPDWTLLAISHLVSGAIVVLIRSVSGGVG